MAREFFRSDRVGDAIQRELASLIQQEVRDPRVGMVNVNAVKVTRDLAHARVFVTFVNDLDQANVAQRIKVLNQASGFIRAQLSHRIDLRIVPHLKFEFDESIYRGEHMSKLIDSLNIPPEPDSDSKD